MSAADNGGWDLTVEIAANALSSAVSAAFAPQLPPQPVATPLFQGTVTPKARVTGVTLNTNADLTTNVSVNGTLVRVTNLTVPLPGVQNPPPQWLSDITIDGTVRVTDRLEMRANALVIDFTPTPVQNQPDVVAEVDEGSVLKSPLVQIALAYVFSLGGQTAFEQARTTLLQMIRTAMETNVRAAVVAAGTVTLAPAPVLPPPLAITASGLRTTPASLHVLYAIGGPPGNTSLITRSMLLTSSITGAPVDAAAISLSNTSLLRDFVRGALTAPPLALPAAGFLVGHPCFFIGPAPIPVPGGAVPGITGVTLNTLIAGIDEAGLLHLVVRLTAAGTSGAFSVDASIDSSFAFSATAAPGAGGGGEILTFTVTPVLPPAVASDASIAWWMYLAGALVGGLTLVGVLAAIDAFSGLLLSGAIATAVGGALPTIAAPVPLPGRVPALAVRALRATQADSTRRTITLFPGATLTDPFRSHDVIVNLV